MRNYARLAQDCDSLVKAGRVAEAAKRLTGLNTAPVPREWRLPLANVCRRTGLITLGMKLLYRVIYPAKTGSQPATSAELAEYGVLLHRFGSLAESVDILKKADPGQAPEALLFQAFCHFNRWEYAQSVPMLERYIEVQPAAYQKFLGEVNLSAALVWSEQWARGMETVTGNIETAGANNYGRLQGNCYELRAQIHIYKRDFAKARADLEASSQLLGTTGVVDSLFVHKWKAILESFESKSVEKLIGLKKESLVRRDGETAREADRFRLLIQFDQATFDHLLFGTPYPEFRKMLCRQMRRQPNGSEYSLGSGSRFIDVENGEIDNLPVVEELRAGGKCHKVLAVLLRDFYRPLRLGGLHAELFPGDHFDVFSSPGRVHQILFRTREWIERNRLPIEIKEAEGFYALDLGSDLVVRVPYEHGEVSLHDVQWRKLKSCFAHTTEFTAKEAREKLGLPRTSFQRLITWAEEEKKIERVGEYNTTAYRIAA